MPGRDRFAVTRELVRSAARCLRHEPQGAPGLVRAASRAAAAGVSDHFLLPALAALRGAGEPGAHRGFELPQGLLAVQRRRDGIAQRNARLLALLGERTGGAHEPVLLGDAAALPLLYGDLGAFEAQLWIGGVADASVAGDPAIEAHLRSGGGRLTSLATKPRAYFESRSGAAVEIVPGWRLPSRSAFLALGVARLGDPLAHPEPPLWFHVAVAAKAWGPELPIAEVLALGRQLDVSDRLERGLAILQRLFPAVATWLGPHRVALPLIERKLAVPLAAYRLASGAAQPAAPVAELDLLTA